MEQYSLLGLVLFIIVLGAVAFRPFADAETFDEDDAPPGEAGRRNGDGKPRRP